MWRPAGGSASAPAASSALRPPAPTAPAVGGAGPGSIHGCEPASGSAPDSEHGAAPGHGPDDMTPASTSSRSVDLRTNDSPAAIRRRRRRRVADENRKRAPRACDRCKARKSKCIESTPGSCQRCLYNNLACRFERERTPPDEADDESSKASQTAMTPRSVVKSPDEGISIDGHQTERIMWPRFLSRLREAFSLDLHPVGQERDLLTMQTNPRPTVLHPWEMRRLGTAIDAFPPRSVADFLLSVCINHGTDAFFYFDQGQFLHDIDQFYSDPHSPLRADCSFICLALATFALGSQWTTLEKPEGTSGGLHPDDGDPGRMFHNHARMLMPDVVDRPCLRSVQAPFVMGVYLLPASSIGSSYIYMGLALRKALALDLHLNTEDPMADEREKEAGRRLWWTIFSLERTTTVKLNRPRSISADIITVPLPAPLPILDRDQRFNNLQHQIANARLIKILDRVAELGSWLTVTTTARPPDNGEADLKEWKRTLPPNFKLELIDPRDSGYRAVFHLYLNHYYAWIAMGKVSVVTVVRSHLRYYFGREPEPPRIDDAVSRLSKSCIKAAKKMLQLFENLTRTGNITRFSFTDFQGCSIATIVALLAGILERDSGYEARVNFGMDCLKRMAAGNTTAKMGVRFVEALQSIADEAVGRLHRTEAYNADTSKSATPHTGSDYNRWVEWLQKTDRPQHSGASTPSGRSQPIEPTMPASQAHSWVIPPIAMSHNNNSGGGGVAEWTQAGAQGHVLPLPPLVAPGLQGQQVPGMSHHSPAADGDFMSGVYNDDQSFLMGLTGLDVLDFSGFPPME